MIIAEIVYIVNVLMSGRFIVLEGPDGSGTTRHSQFLAKNLEEAGLPVLLTAEPTQNQLGRTIRQLLQESGSMAPETLQLLFCADRAEHVAGVILPALAEGKTVISDRYFLSTIIYGAAMGVDADWLRAVNNHFPAPDLTIVTLPPFDVCLQRLGKRSYTDAFEAEEMQRQVYKGYKEADSANTIYIDTTDEKEVVAKRVLELVRDKFKL